MWRWQQKWPRRQVRGRQSHCSMCGRTRPDQKDTFDSRPLVQPNNLGRTRRASCTTSRLKRRRVHPLCRSGRSLGNCTPCSSRAWTRWGARAFWTRPPLCGYFQEREIDVDLWIPCTSWWHLLPSPWGTGGGVRRPTNGSVSRAFSKKFHSSTGDT